MFVQNRILLSCCFALVAAVAVSGCGGGDGPGPGVARPDALFRADVQNRASEVSTAAVGAAGNAPRAPRAGSVVQSSNNGGDIRVSRDAGGVFGVLVDEGETDEITLVFGDDQRVETRTDDNFEGFEVEPRVNGNTGTIFVHTDIETAEETDWLAGGFWLSIPDGELANNPVIGAFAQGGDPFDNNNIAALEGDAEYAGVATGIYVTGDSTGPQPQVEGIEGGIGYFDADARLTASFGTGPSAATDLGTISGTLSNFVLYTPNEIGVLRPTGDMQLSPADITEQEGGFFTDSWAAEDGLGGVLTGTTDGSTYINAAENGNYRIDLSSGNWGGQFSGNPPEGSTGTEAYPTSVGGTVGATGTTTFTEDGDTHGSDFSLVGTFGAYLAPKAE